MTSELFIDVQPTDITIALTEDKVLVEFQKEGREASFSVGNMYLGPSKIYVGNTTFSRYRSLGFSG